MPPGAFQTALTELQGCMARGEVRLPAAPDPTGRKYLLHGKSHAFLIPAQGSRIQAVPRRELRWVSIFQGLAWTGAMGLGLSWIAGLVGLGLGMVLTPILLASGVAAILFAGSILVSAVISPEAIPVEAHHPLAEEALPALWAALGRSGAAVSSSRSAAQPAARERSTTTARRPPVTLPGYAPARPSRTLGSRTTMVTATGTRAIPMDRTTRKSAIIPTPTSTEPVSQVANP